MEQIYLSRRNLLTLLSKLDRKVNGETTTCTIIKCDNEHSLYPQTMSQIGITAVEDNEYYAERNPGVVLAKDDPDVSKN